MTDLWGFLLQTACVCLVGVLLLVPATLGGGTALLPLSLWVNSE